MDNCFFVISLDLGKMPKFRFMTYICFNIFLHISAQNVCKNSVAYAIHPNIPQWSHMGFPINSSFRQKSHNTHIQTNSITNLYLSSNSIQRNILDSKIRLKHKRSRNPHSWPIQKYIYNTSNEFKIIIQHLMFMIHAKNHNN